MSWWDYGYQISQISNRTTLADGNTWNHEHIALLGKILVSNTTVSHSIVRHLADYVLVWSTRFAGNPGDDIAKSPHMAKIAGASTITSESYAFYSYIVLVFLGSVYKDINPNAFGMDREGRPTRMMAESLVFNLVNYRLNPSTPELPPKTFKEAYTSKHNMVS
jgi:dolichyl-diphosphooligosaccharide---protein glycosyltransferase